MKLHICLLYVPLLLLFDIFFVLSHNHLNSNFEKYDNVTIKSPLYDISVSSSTSCCDMQEVKVIFSSSIVENEYIVKFKGYYKADVRENYIRTVLSSFGIKNWKIILRNNAASKYPSDFDIVNLKEIDQYQALKALNNHPLIKTVTPQRLIQRTLKFINTSDSYVLAYKNSKKRINNLSFSHVSCKIINIFKYYFQFRTHVYV